MTDDPSNSMKKQPLREVLAEELLIAQKLSILLDRETTAIRNRDAETLTELAPQKLQHLQALEGLETHRNHLDTVQQPSTTSGETSQLWQRVLDVIQVCNRKNQLNGAMLSLRQEQIQRAIELIADRDAHELTYAPDGSTKLNSGGLGTSVSA